MNIQHSMSKYVVAAAIASALGAAQADEIRSYSFPDGIVFGGGGPGPGQFVADRTVYTRNAQFAEFGRGGHIAPLKPSWFVRAADGVSSEAGGDGPLTAASCGVDRRHARPTDRFGRE